MNIVQLTGTPSINGRQMKNSKAVEFAYLMTRFDTNSPYIYKEDAFYNLYKDYGSANSLWYAVSGCRKAGLDVRYSKSDCRYFLDSPAVSDLGIVIEKLREQKPWEALFFLRGPILPETNDSFSEIAREKLLQLLNEQLECLADFEQESFRSEVSKRRIVL